jgi:hypothetical protein
VSLPSGEVGGDLVDLVEVEGRWLGYLADVSGHGVGSGVLMGMVKSAARMKLLTLAALAALLDDLNDALVPASHTAGARGLKVYARRRAGRRDTLASRSAVTW